MISFKLRNSYEESEYPKTLAKYLPLFLYDEKEQVTLTIGNLKYKLVQKLPDGGELLGYIGDRFTFDNNSITGILSSKDKLYPIFKEKKGEVIGYLPVYKENSYVAFVKKDIAIPIIPLFLILLVCFILFYSFLHFATLKKPLTLYSNDAITQGVLTGEKETVLHPSYFNIKINATPIAEKGKMNIRIENSQRNLLKCRIDVKLDIDGKMTALYQSPILSPNQSLEYATVDESLPKGSYDGIATFHYFDDQQELSTTSSVKLVVFVR